MSDLTAPYLDDPARCPHADVRPLPEDPENGFCTACGERGFPLTREAAGLCRGCSRGDGEHEERCPAEEAERLRAELARLRGDWDNALAVVRAEERSSRDVHVRAVEEWAVAAEAERVREKARADSAEVTLLETWDELRAHVMPVLESIAAANWTREGAIREAKEALSGWGKLTFTEAEERGAARVCGAEAKLGNLTLYANRVEARRNELLAAARDALGLFRSLLAGMKAAGLTVTAGKDEAAPVIDRVLSALEKPEPERPPGTGFVPETFEQAWARMEAKGYRYGREALDRVRLGWELRGGEVP